MKWTAEERLHVIAAMCGKVSESKSVTTHALASVIVSAEYVATKTPIELDELREELERLSGELQALP